jgi:hypothetical protein
MQTIGCKIEKIKEGNQIHRKFVGTLTFLMGLQVL